MRLSTLPTHTSDSATFGLVFALACTAVAICALLLFGGSDASISSVTDFDAGRPHAFPGGDVFFVEKRPAQ